MNQRILYIVPGFALNESDEHCLPHVQDLLHAFSGLGITGEIISLHYPTLAATSYNWHNWRIHHLGWNNPSSLRKPFLLKKAIRHLKSNLNFNQFDLIHAFWITDTCALAERLSKAVDLPFIVTAMGQDVQKSIYFNSASKASEIITISKWQQEQLQKNGNLNSVVNPFGVNQIGTLPHQHRPIDLIGVGSLISLKSFRSWVNEFAQLYAENTALKGVLIGSGPLENELKEQAKTLGVDQAICFRGQLSRLQVLEALQQSKVLYHPSNFEGQGMVVLEALAMGCKVMAHPVGEAYSNRHVILAEPHLIGSELKRLLQSHHFKPVDVRTIDQTARTYQQLYSNWS